MARILVVVDYQKDFVDGALGYHGAESLLPGIRDQVEAFLAAGDPVYFTLDTHGEDYLQTQEGKGLPVERLQPLDAIGCQCDLVPCFREQSVQNSRNGGFVFYHQNPLFHTTTSQEAYHTLVLIWFRWYERWGKQREERTFPCCRDAGGVYWNQSSNLNAKVRNG